MIPKFVKLHGRDEHIDARWQELSFRYLLYESPRYDYISGSSITAHGSDWVSASPSSLLLGP